jgi:uncharacterized membrane protein YczE
MSTGIGRFGVGSRTRNLAERRLSLVRLLIALFVARVVVTIAEIAESRLTFFSALITAAVGLEAWRAWTVARVARRNPTTPVALPPTVWDRILRPAERYGPAVLCVLTIAFVIATLVLLGLGESIEVLLDITLVVRELTTLAFVAVLLIGYLSVRGVSQPST